MLAYCLLILILIVVSLRSKAKLHSLKKQFKLEYWFQLPSIDLYTYSLKSHFQQKCPRYFFSFLQCNKLQFANLLLLINEII